MFPDERWQERPLAVVVVREGATVSAGDLRVRSWRGTRSRSLAVAAGVVGVCRRDSRHQRKVWHDKKAIHPSLTPEKVPTLRVTEVQYLTQREQTRRNRPFSCVETAFAVCSRVKVTRSLRVIQWATDRSVWRRSVVRCSIPSSNCRLLRIRRPERQKTSAKSSVHHHWACDRATNSIDDVFGAGRRRGDLRAISARRSIRSSPRRCVRQEPSWLNKSVHGGEVAHQSPRNGTRRHGAELVQWSTDCLSPCSGLATSTA